MDRGHYTDAMEAFVKLLFSTILTVSIDFQEDVWDIRQVPLPFFERRSRPQALKDLRGFNNYSAHKIV